MFPKKKFSPISKDVSFFAALCLFLSAIEYLIPKPLPFLRLGLANLPIILALRKFDFKSYFVLVIFKVLGQSFVSGTIFSYIFLFSICGSLCSSLTMYLFYKLMKEKVSAIGLSLSGAMASNAAQIVLAHFYLFKDGVKYIAPMLFSIGAVSGFVLGLIAQLFMEKSNWYALVPEKKNVGE